MFPENITHSSHFQSPSYVSPIVLMIDFLRTKKSIFSVKEMTQSYISGNIPSSKFFLPLIMPFIVKNASKTR